MNAEYNSKYTTYLDVYARLTSIIKHKKINPADVLTWCVECETEWIGDFPSLVPHLKVKLQVKDKSARIPPYSARILDVFKEDGSKVSYYNNGAYLVFNSDFTDKHIYINFMGIAIDPEKEIPYIKKGHEEACMRHCIVNLYYEDFLNGKISGQVYGEMKEERNLQVQAAIQDYSTMDRKELMEIAAVRLNMMPYLRINSNYHTEIGG